jgi:hypothetical protein
MSRARGLHPVDIPVALHLATSPRASYATLADDLSLSVSTAHDSVSRLMFVGLARLIAKQRQVNRSALLELLRHGSLRYFFPAIRDRNRRGIPTAHAAPAMRGYLDADIDPVVWPTSRGTVIGHAITPLLPRVADLPERCPAVYDLLTLVDAMRIGTARDREIAGKLLTERLVPSDDVRHDDPVPLTARA